MITKKHHFLSFKDYRENFAKEVDIIREQNIEKHKQYGQSEDFFSSFRLAENFGFMKIEELLFMRGILDKLKRISNITKKQGHHSVAGEGLTESVYDVIGYSLLIHAYYQCKKKGDFGSETALEAIKIMMDEVAKIAQEKNNDYSNASSGENKDNYNAFENFNLAEDYNLSSVENGILARIAIKVQRINNHIINQADTKTIGADILDMITYGIILVVYLKTLKKAPEVKEEKNVVMTNATIETNKKIVKDEPKQWEGVDFFANK